MDFNDSFDKKHSAARPVKRSLFIIVFLFFSGLALFVDYYFPEFNQVVFIGEETKEIKETKDAPAKQIHLIKAKVLKNNSEITLRNENTEFGFPFYFKFNSKHLEKQAQTLIENKTILEIKTYGFHIKLLEAYPNLIETREVKSGTPITKPGAKYALFALLAILFLIAMFAIKYTFRYD